MSNRWLLLIVMAGTLCACGYLDHRDVCQACRRPLHEQTAYRITLDNGEVQTVCCPRCGLHVQSGRHDVVSAETSDYPSGRMIPASQAFYVENSSVMLCCSLDKLRRDRSGSQYALGWDRCLPSLVSFEALADARQFEQEHGGVVKTYEQLQSEPDFAQPMILDPGH